MDVLYKAFVIMPFNPDFNDTYNLGIKAAAKECNVDARRLDEDFFTTNMVEEIHKRIDDADFIIADMTGRNPNVFYEVGYAEAKNKLILLLTKNISDIPFDFKQKLHIEYSNISSLKTKLVERIDWAKNEIVKRNNSLLDIVFSIDDADIARDEYADDAIVNYTLEIKNLSDEPIEKLQMIDLLTGSGWDFFIGDNKIKSELLEDNTYKQKRHRFIPDEKIIPAHDHIIINLRSKKRVWAKWDKTSQKDEYPLSGWVDIKIHVNNKNITKRLELDGKASYNPFPSYIPF